VSAAGKAKARRARRRASGTRRRRDGPQYAGSTEPGGQRRCRPAWVGVRRRRDAGVAVL